MNGIINILKPPGMTSSNVVVFIRRLLNIKKVGHSGTLDPAAAGVLPTFCGSATRLCEYALADDKEYIGEISFGAATDTQDAQGMPIATSDLIISPEQAEDLFRGIVGRQKQLPPKYSALKKDGKKLYEYARAGQDVDIKPREITIHSSELLHQTSQNRFLFRIACSKGTYIRTICHDIGELSGAHAHLSFLLRSKTGDYALEDSITLGDLEMAVSAGETGSVMQPMESAVAHMPKVILTAEAEKAARNGGAISGRHIAECQVAEGEAARLYIEDSFLGICVGTGQGIRISKVLA